MFLAPASASRDVQAVAYPGQSLVSREIRIVRLHPGAWNDPIVCDLVTVDIETAKYQALSYVWGSKKVNQFIRLNNRIFGVTLNLFGALKHLREKFSDGIVLWVDALCIDQSNVDERTHQVQLMGKIYSRCIRVIVYLGDRLDSSKPLLDAPAAQEFGGTNASLNKETQQKNAHRPCLPDVFGLFHELSGLQDRHLEDVEAFKDTHGARVDLFEALRRFMQTPFTPWWSRIWVVQEITLASNPLVVYGMISAPWEMFATAAINFNKHSNQCCRDFIDRIPRDQIRVIQDSCQRIHDVNDLRLWRRDLDPSKQLEVGPHRALGPDSMLGLLRSFRDRKASDPRDKVYALLSLARLPPTLKAIVPDYSLDDVTVFSIVTLQIINESMSLSVLSTELGRKFRNDLPSWVPDWGAPGGLTYGIRADVAELYQASAPLERVLHNLQNLVIHDKSGRNLFGNPHPFTLALKGFAIDTVGILGGTMWGEDTQQCQETIEGWWLLMSDKLSEQTLDLFTGRQIFVRTLCADVLCGTMLGLRPRRIRPKDELSIYQWCSHSARSPGSWEDFSWGDFSDILRLGESVPGTSWPAIFGVWSDYPTTCFMNDTNPRLFGFKPNLDVYEKSSQKMLEFASKSLDELNPQSFAIAASPRGPLRSSGGRLQGLEEALRDRLSIMNQRDLPIHRSNRPAPKEMEQMIDDSIMAATLGQRFVIGRDNDVFGLVPSGTRAGDQLYFLSGGKTPFVLRPVHDKLNRIVQNTFEVIGACYLQGLMDGGMYEVGHLAWSHISII